MHRPERRTIRTLAQATQAQKRRELSKQLQASKMPMSCDVTLLCALISFISVRDDEDVASHFITIDHQPNLCPFLNGPQNWGTNKTAFEKATRRTFTA